MNGQIVRLMLAKGFGFIRGEDKDEYFFHKTGLERAIRFEMLREGMNVSFRATQTQKGPRAEDIHLQI